MKLSDFSYDLPRELIAQTPLNMRDQSRMLALSRNTDEINHMFFSNLPNYLSEGDTLVLNDTKVIPARLFGKRNDTGGKIEIFLLNRITATDWEVLVKPGKKARIGTIIEFSSELSCEILSMTDFGGRIVRFKFVGIFEDLLFKIGETPLPPYIHEKLSDNERYQTVYAKHNGSAAAPTAGLHFTPEMLTILKKKGVNIAYITLHVGLGTFRPVTVDNIHDHVMHQEYYSLSSETAKEISDTKKNGKKVFAVGTTVVRTLETMATANGINHGSGYTKIFIYPGYEFKVVDAIITNFHLPESTLLMLVSAFAGKEKVLAAYREAVKERYRFFSFGDAMLLY